MKKVILLAFILIFAPVFTFAAQEDSDQIQARLFSTDGAITGSFTPFDEDYRGSGSIATADLGNDGISELIIGAGPGLTPDVMIYRQDGTEIGSFLAYEETFDRGVNVAVCDVDNDSEMDIITAPMFGGGPHVRIFNTWGELKSEFFAYDETFLGGVNISCGDVDGDGFDDIITGPGITGGPHVRIFSNDGTQLFEMFTGSADDNTGITVAAADLNGDGDAEIISGRAGYGNPTVVVLDLINGQLRFVLSLDAFDDYRNGIQVFSGDIDQDGMDEIGATTQGGYETSIALFEMTGAKALSLTTDGESTEHGIVASFIEDDDPTLFTLTSEQKTQNETGQYILVDLSEQTLYAYEDGALVLASLVSTGKYYYPTPQGRTEVSAKLLWHDYVWSYGEDDPSNYSLPDVKYNMRFRSHYYLHYAYWHNNFGNKMSHGCVNMPYDEIEFVYNWADVGVGVEIVE
ncbi:L,D-transpeptidase family protein [Candidatus Uhrbacteria bacterium]|nr:L,D-transpeptidase family protein [Candidatus Uhrbacteria bacterium]